MLKQLIYLIAFTTMLSAGSIKEIELPSKVIIEKGFEIVVMQSSSPLQRTLPITAIICNDESLGCGYSGLVVYSENDLFKILFDESFMKFIQNGRLLSIKTEYRAFTGTPYTQLIVSDNVANNYTFEEIKSYLNSIDFANFNQIIIDWKIKNTKETFSKSEKRSTWR